MKIVVFEVEEWERHAFEGLKADHEIVFVNASLYLQNVGEFADAEIVAPFIYSDLSANVLSQLSRLQLLATRSTRYDHIDLEYCRQNNIIVCNVPVYGDNTVAEHVFGLLLAISHNLIDTIDRTRRGNYSQTGLQGFDLLGKTFGVIGAGSIG